MSEKCMIAAKLKENVFPSNKEVIKHYCFKRSFLQHTDSKLNAKSPELKKNQIFGILAVFRRSFAIAEVAKKLIMDRIVNERIIILVDSQAAILAIQNNIVKSNTILSSIKNLNILGKDNDVTIA